MVVTVVVTKEMIASGVKAVWNSCPVAKGFRAAGFKRADVYNVYAYPLGDHPFENYSRGGTHRGIRYSLPPHVVEFIKRFDNGESVEPISFEVVLPGWLF